MDATESKRETSTPKAVAIYEGHDYPNTRSVNFVVFPVGSISLPHNADVGPFRTFRDIKVKHKEIKQVIIHFSRYRPCSLSTPPPIRTRADYKEDDGCVARVIEILEDPEFPDSTESVQVTVYDDADPKSWPVSPVFPSRLLRLPSLQSLTIIGIQFTSLPKEATAIKHLAIYAGDSIRLCR